VAADIALFGGDVELTVGRCKDLCDWEAGRLFDERLYDPQMLVMFATLAHVGHLAVESCGTKMLCSRRFQ
jgi:hypothetical protein